VTHVPFRISAVTSHPRQAVFSALSAALSDLGWILDFKQFSNLALSVRFEMPRDNVTKVRAAMAALPLRLADHSLEALAVLEGAAASELPDPVPAGIHVTFIHSEPDLRIPVPAVPG
jgi:hypothetical protein